MGPSTQSVEDIEALAKRGIAVCRLNFSHGTHEKHAEVIRNICEVRKKGYPLAIMLDTKGPEVRTGDVLEPFEIAKGETVIFAHKAPKNAKEKVIAVDYPSFAKDVKHARCIFVDNGVLEFEVIKITGDIVFAKAKNEGQIGSRRHINLPGANVSLPPFTARDWSDIRFGIENGVDFIANSFVRKEEDIAKLRAFLVKHGSTAEIIAKIETPQAVEDIDRIIASSDGIMVARGDLGAEVPFEDVPSIEEDIVRKCRLAGKPVIVATHMLESMILSPIPTRAEVTDVAFASFLQADSTMLSGETASGRHPKKSVEVMDLVLRKNEKKSLDSSSLLSEIVRVSASEPHRMQAYAACVLADSMKADALLVMSRSGRTARAVSACRPSVPIHAFTETEQAQRRMLLLWGVTPHIRILSDDPNKTVQAAIDLMQKEKILKKGQRVVVVSDIRSTKNRIMTIQIREID